MTKMSHLAGVLLLLVIGAAGCTSSAPLGTNASDGVVEVRYLSGRVGKVAFGSGENKSMSDKDALQLRISIENRSDSAKLEYKGWGGDSLGSGFKATLKDDLGNEYKAVNFGSLRRPVGQKSKESLYPGTLFEDVLIFEVPVDKAQLMHLSLPRGNYLPSVGGPKALELAIPTSTFNGAE